MKGRRTLPLVLAVNLLLLALYIWAATETTIIEIGVTDNRLVASVEGYELPIEAGDTDGTAIGLYVAGAQQQRTYDDAGPPSDSPLAFLNPLAGRLRQEPLGPAWQRLIVTDAGGRVLRDEQFRDTKAADWSDRTGTWHVNAVGDYAPDATRTSYWGSTSILKNDGRSTYRLTAILRRSSTPAGILPLATDSENGLILLVRPEARDMYWFRLVEGRWEGPLATGFWSKSWVGLLQSDLRLLLVPAQLAAAVTLLFLTLGLVVAYGMNTAWRLLPARLRLGQKVAADKVGLTVPRSDRAGDPAARSTLLAIFIAVIATSLTAYVARVVLEAIPHVQDDVTYLFQARVFALGRLWVPASPIPQAFEQEFIVNYAGRAFGKYPPGHSLMLLPGVLAGVPWLINPLQAGLTVVVVYLIGRAVYGARAALLAAILVTASPFFIFMSGSMMAHPTGLLFLSVFVLLFIRAADSPAPSYRTSFLAGLAIGFAFITRPWTAVAVAAPFAIYAVFELARMRRRAFRRYIPIAGGFSLLAVGVIAYNYALTGIPFKNPMELWWAFDKLGFASGVGISGAHSLADGLFNTYRNLGELEKHLFGWPSYLTLALALVPFVTLRARRWDWLFLAGVFSLILAQIAWWADGVMYGPRYYYEILGLLALLSARGITTVAGLVCTTTGRLRQAGGRVRQPVDALCYLFVFALIGYNVAHYLPVQWSLHHGYNYIDGESLRAVDNAQLHRAVVFVDLGNWYEWWNYGSVFPANTPTLDGDVVYARNRGPAENKQLMELYPDRQYYYLQGETITELRP